MFGKVRRCPDCACALEQTRRRGVRLDVCPSCRGIWLDKGELTAFVAASTRGRGRGATAVTAVTAVTARRAGGALSVRSGAGILFR